MNISVISYRDEVIVEILATDEYGEPEAISYQFGYGDDSHELVPKQSIGSKHIAAIKDELAAEGYHVDSPPTKHS